MDYRRLINEAIRSDRRLKIGQDPEVRLARLAELREMRVQRRYLERVRAEQEDRDRYIIPEFQDLEEMLTDPIS